MLNREIANLQREIDAIHSFNANRSTHIANCVADLRTRYTPASLYQEAQRRSAHEAVYTALYNKTYSMTDSLLVRVKQHIMAGAVWNAVEFDRYLQSTCASYNPVKSANAKPGDLQALMRVRDALS